MTKLKITTVGSSVGIVLPKELLKQLNVTKGDYLFAAETKDGLVLTPFDPELEEVMEATRRGMKKYRNALRELAK